jgi:hypothetical protein
LLARAVRRGRRRRGRGSAASTPYGDSWDVVASGVAHDDPTLPALQAAFARRSAREGWHVTREQEDVCPVLTLPGDGDWETYLASLDKKERHEIRRKIRRAEAAGRTPSASVDPDVDAVDAFIDLHRAALGDDGLFGDSCGDRSRSSSIGWQLELAEGSRRQLQLGHFEVAAVVMAAVAWITATSASSTTPASAPTRATCHPA